MFGRRKKPHQLNPNELEALARFANCEITLEELLAHLPEIEFTLTENKRTLTSHYVVLEPGIRIELSNIATAQQRLPADALKRWATMILLNNAYEWTGPNEDQIADRLNELSTSRTE